MKKTLSLLYIFVLLTACTSISGTTPTPPQVDTVIESDFTTTLTLVTLGAGRGVRGDWFELYFTDPTSPLASQETGGPDGPLANAIDEARLSVDVAIYSLSLNSIRDALLRAHDRGVRVRMVMESDNLDRSDPQKLKDAGIPILGDRREGLMHNKFVVIDNSEVWLGSMNFTDSGAYVDNNNLMKIRSTKVAENFTTEFEEMFEDDIFGPDAGYGTPNPRVTIDGTPIDIYFSPDDHVQAALVDLIGAAAQDSIYFMAYSFTADPIGSVMRVSAADGLTVAGVMDADQIKSNVGTEFDPFSKAELDVYKDGIPGLMHHKVIIIDKSIVIFGSYNFTNSAETRNDETLVVIYNRDIAAQFMEEFQIVFKAAQ